MTKNLIIYVKDGQVQSVLSDFKDEIQCLIVRSNDGALPHIKGEPWVKPMDFPEADSQPAVLEPVSIVFDPQKVQEIMSLEELSKHELLKLLR